MKLPRRQFLHLAAGAAARRIAPGETRALRHGADAGAPKRRSASRPSGSAPISAWSPFGLISTITHVMSPPTDHEQKRAALGYLNAAWAKARIEGIDGDCLAQVCLFAAFAEFVSTYGEEAVARFAERLAIRIRNGEFSLTLTRQ
jgi:hypothetical protein